MLQERYSSYDTGVGQKINKVQTSFEELEVIRICLLDIEWRG